MMKINYKKQKTISKILLRNTYLKQSKHKPDNEYDCNDKKKTAVKMYNTIPYPNL